ncbi:MAG: XrtA-associated tyrosine autokinase [Burkholderiaceae bacterium]|nr:XrtA-associated tyrosine autokinase [Burkholderiaceae bacterium]
MSLIERAAGKIPGRDPETDKKGPEGEAPGAPKSTIEELMERTALARAAEAPAKTTEPAAPAAEVASPAAIAKASVPTTVAAAQEPSPAAPPTKSSATPVPPASAIWQAHIQLETLRARGYVTPEGDQERIGQEFRVIKRPLLENAFGRNAAHVRNGRRVMITSAFPSEGKTFCAINLAMSIAAERDCQVMLIDADVARPAMLRELGIAATAGLMDCLIDGTPDVTTLVQPTNVEKLSILPAGRQHGQSTELLASDAMTTLVERLSESYPDTILVFDSPPLLLTTEARALAGHMGQIVLVVEAGRTPQDGVTEALATIEHCEVVGLVLNKAQSRSKGYYSGYTGYGYGYAKSA